MPIYLSCLISDCGRLLHVVPQISGTAPTGGYDQLVGVTAVTGVPTPRRNGTPESIGPVTWDEGNGPYGGPGSVLTCLLTAGPALASDVFTVDIPANFVNGSSPAYTGNPVTNGTGGGLEPAFGKGVIAGATGCPGLDTATAARVAADTGGPALDTTATNYLLWNQVYRAHGWEWAAGSSGVMNQDENRNLLSWAAGQTIRLSCCDLAASSSGLNVKGTPNQPGKWTLVIPDTGTIPSTFNLIEVTGNATVALLSTTTTTTTTTKVFDVQYTSSDPVRWEMSLSIVIVSPPNNTGGSDGLAHWAFGTLGTPDAMWLSPPALDGSAMAVDRSNPFAINPNVRAQLTSGGKTVEHIRQMESFGGDGLCNRIYACDLPQIAGFWPNGRSCGPVTFSHVRFCNTDPAKGSKASGGDGTYDWPASTRVYGPQADSVFNDGGTTAIVAIVKAGAHAITITSGTPLLAGGIIAGPGIPDNTRLASFNGKSGWLEHPATADGPQSLTLHNPGYLQLSPGDRGAFAINGFGAQNWAVAELRSDTPHGLTTGYYPGGTWGNPVNTTHGNGVEIAGFGRSDPTVIQSPICVTGPYTILTAWYAGQGTGSAVNTIVPAAEYDFTATGGWQFNVQIPFDLSATFAYEAHIAMQASLGCNACYLTLPIWGTDALYAAIGKMAHDYGTPAMAHRLEVADEPWNGGNPFFLNVIGRLARQNLYGQQPAGTAISEYYTTTGTGLPFGDFATAQNVLLTGHAGKVFADAFAAAGGDASKVELVAGSQYNNSGITRQIAGAAQTWGVPIDWVTIATYISTPPSASIVAAYSTAGAAWPLAAINDHARIYHAYSYYEQSFYAAHTQILRARGEPLEGGFVDNATASGGFSPDAGYKVWYTHVDADGNESTVGQSESNIFGVPAGTQPRFHMPHALHWVVSINVFLGASDWESRQSFLYMNVPVAGHPPGSTVMMTAAYDTSTTRHPPTTSGIPSGTAGKPQRLAGYEGGQVQPVPTNMATPYRGNPEWMGLTHDVFADPSAVLDVPTWAAKDGIGCQWLPGSGLEYTTYYQVWGIPAPAFLSGNILNYYMVYAGTGQSPGAGLSNRYALRGSPGDGVDHNGGTAPNECPRGLGLQRTIAGPPPPPQPLPAISPGPLECRFVATWDQASGRYVLSGTLTPAPSPTAPTKPDGTS